MHIRILALALGLGLSAAVPAQAHFCWWDSFGGCAWSHSHSYSITSYSGSTDWNNPIGYSSHILSTSTTGPVTVSASYSYTYSNTWSASVGVEKDGLKAEVGFDIERSTTESSTTGVQVGPGPGTFDVWIYPSKIQKNGVASILHWQGWSWYEYVENGTFSATNNFSGYSSRSEKK